MIPYTVWSSVPLGAPYNRCSPNLLAVQRHLLDAAGGQPLGCYGVRPITGGSSPSTHSWGAALDWRYGNVGGGHVEIGRDAFLSFVLPWLLGNADALGIQQIHNYRDASIWRTGRGWKPNDGPGMGAAWAEYIHIETNRDAWSDARSILNRGVSPLVMHSPEPTPPPNPEVPRMNPITIDVPTLRLGSTGRDVLRLQALIRDTFGQQHVELNSVFDAATDSGVRNVQTWCHLTVDGWVGPQTWRALLVSP